MSGLSELRFSDIYVGVERSWLSGLPDGGDPVPTPESVHSDVIALRELCEQRHSQTGRNEFNVRHNGVVYRASTLVSLEETVYVLRRFPSRVPPLTELGLHPGILGIMMQPKMTGLIVIAGAFSQGKTTTASSLVRERLSQFGGICVTIEDPPEMPLQGRHGEGVCYQTEVDQGGFAAACRHAARWAPTMIFLGEIRDAETANEALKASINGRLVICTIHADSAPSAIHRLYTLANNSASVSSDVSSLLANGLAAVLHQSLEGIPKRPCISPIVVQTQSDDVSAKNIIRNRKWEQLDNVMKLQMNKMANTLRNLGR